MGPPWNQYEPPLTERQPITSPEHAPLYEEDAAALQALATPKDWRIGSGLKGPTVGNFLEVSQTSLGEDSEMLK